MWHQYCQLIMAGAFSAARSYSLVMRGEYRVKKSPESPLIESIGQHCADCGIPLGIPLQVGATCSECGQPLCRDCARADTEDGEPMLCRSCWESQSISTDDAYLPEHNAYLPEH
jgi:hypothetical protein